MSGLIRVADGTIVLATGFGAHLSLVFAQIHGFDNRYATAALFGALAFLLVAERLGLYTDELIFGRRLPLRGILAAIGGAMAILLAVGFALKISEEYSRLWLGCWALSASCSLVVERIVLGRRLRVLTAAGRLTERAIILGAGEHGQRLASHLERHSDGRTQVLGFIDDRHARVPGRFEGLHVLGDTEHLVRLIRDDKVDHVYIALPWSAQARLADLIDRLATMPVDIRLAPDLIGFQLAGNSYSTLAGLPMLRVFDRPIAGWSHVAKRVEDCIVAGFALLFLAPLMLLIAAAVKLDSPGPVLFRQRRQGFNDGLFEVWKFRTMYVNQSDANCEVQTTKGDPRITRVGNFLRKSSLDELPQILNVLRGDMSIVGPRPHAISTKAEGKLFQDVVHKYAARHRVKPGITGWAQVNGWRGETDTIDKIKRRVECDLYYIDHWSIRFDLTIIMRTALAVLRRDNAY